MSFFEQVVSKFEAFGFKVQDTSKERQIESDNLSGLKKYDFPNNDAANLLIFYPDLLVVHPDLRPEHGILYVIIREDAKLSDTEQALYETYIPDEMILTFVDGNEIRGLWLNQGESRLLDELLSDIVND